MCTMWIGQCVYNVDGSVCVQCGYVSVHVMWIGQCVYNVDR